MVKVIYIYIYTGTPVAAKIPIPKHLIAYEVVLTVDRVEPISKACFAK